MDIYSDGVDYYSLENVLGAKKRWSEHEIEKGRELLEEHKDNNELVEYLKRAVHRLEGCVLAVESMEEFVRYYKSDRA